MGKKWRPRDIEEIENRAWQVLQEFRQRFTSRGMQAPDMPPVPVEDIARMIAQLDIQPVADLTHEGRKLSGRLDPALSMISYEAADNPGRRAFTIAHELGHLYLHYLPLMQAREQPALFTLDAGEQEEGAQVTQPPYFRCTEADMVVALREAPAKGSHLSTQDHQALAEAVRREERHALQESQANRFAAALLMPEPYIEQLLKEGYDTPSKLAVRLGVSPAAADVRLVSLGYRERLQLRQDAHDPNQRRLF